MSYLRLKLDLAVLEPIPQELEDALPKIKEGIKKLKSFASNINEGLENEENTTRATYHKCYHDESPMKSCEPEVEI